MSVIVMTETVPDTNFKKRSFFAYRIRVLDMKSFSYLLLQCQGGKVSFLVIRHNYQEAKQRHI